MHASHFHLTTCIFIAHTQCMPTEPCARATLCTLSSLDFPGPQIHYACARLCAVHVSDAVRRYHFIRVGLIFRYHILQLSYSPTCCPTVFSCGSGNDGA